MRDEIVDIVRDALKATFGSTFKAYYDGDPDAIPEFNLPCLVISKLGDETDVGTMAEDDVTERVTIKVILNKKDDWTAEHDDVELTEKKIRRYVEARDADTGQFIPESVKYAVRQLIDQNGWMIVGATSFELGSLQRTRELVTMEGHVTFAVTYSVMVNDYK